jgi:hypothetical protein
MNIYEYSYIYLYIHVGFLEAKNDGEYESERVRLEALGNEKKSEKLNESKRSIFTSFSSFTKSVKNLDISAEVGLTERVEVVEPSVRSKTLWKGLSNSLRNKSFVNNPTIKKHIIENHNLDGTEVNIVLCY